MTALFAIPVMTFSSFIISLMTIVLLIVAGLMVFMILMQESKGGGLSALGGTSASATLGVSNPLRRATVWLAIVFFIISIFITVIGRYETAGNIGFNMDDEAAPAMKQPDEKPEIPIVPIEEENGPEAADPDDAPVVEDDADAPEADIAPNEVED